MKKKKWKRYVVLSSGKLYDIWDQEIAAMFDTSYIKSYYITKSNRLCCKTEWDEVDDWFADIGYITHGEIARNYLGKVKYASNNMLTILNNCYLNNCLIYFDQNPEVGVEMVNKLSEKEFKNVVKIVLNNNKYYKDNARIFTKHPDLWWGTKLYWTEREDQYVAN